MGYNDLSEKEKIDLLRYKDFFDALISGKRNPTTKAQEHFLSVVNKEAAAETSYELLYLKFLDIPSQETNIQEELDVPEDEEMTPSDGWYPRGTKVRNGYGK